MRVFINGEEREIEDGATVAELLVRFAMDKGRVAVERNREIVPRSRHAEERLAEGDRIEIVHMVGGG